MYDWNWLCARRKDTMRHTSNTFSSDVSEEIVEDIFTKAKILHSRSTCLCTGLLPDNAWVTDPCAHAVHFLVCCVVTTKQWAKICSCKCNAQLLWFSRKCHKCNTLFKWLQRDVKSNCFRLYFEFAAAVLIVMEYNMEAYLSIF